MNTSIKNENGITLIELLVVLALLGTIIGLISSVHIFGQKQFASQSKQIQHESNVRYAMNMITKEVRSSRTIAVSNNTIQTSTSLFELKGTDLYKGDVVLEEDIGELIVQQSGNKISITIKSVPNQYDKISSLSTNVYIRE
jgi:prepilin-type N-terminal cleavage/methylation domain-containing protein